jgi:hypothetical protein
MTPFLILHKVRGEPAFDVAIQLQIGDKEGWIIPTSGHRAYPYWKIELNSIIQEDMHSPAVPDDWPDHYACNDSGTKTEVNIMQVISNLLPKVRRRV